MIVDKRGSGAKIVSRPKQVASGQANKWPAPAIIDGAFGLSHIGTDFFCVSPSRPSPLKEEILQMDDRPDDVCVYV